MRRWRSRATADVRAKRGGHIPGVRAAHAMFTLRLLGYNQVRNYDGSWQEWGNRPDLPIAR